MVEGYAGGWFEAPSSGRKIDVDGTIGNVLL